MTFGDEKNVFSRLNVRMNFGDEKTLFSTQCKDELWWRKNAFFQLNALMNFGTKNAFYRLIDEFWGKKNATTMEKWRLKSYWKPNHFLHLFSFTVSVKFCVGYLHINQGAYSERSNGSNISVVSFLLQKNITRSFKKTFYYLTDLRGPVQFLMKLFYGVFQNIKLENLWWAEL